MRTLAQKQNQPQKPVSSSLAQPDTATLEPAHREHPILQLQRTIGNQAVQRMLQTNAEGTIQTKLAINKPGDEYEQEADRIAEQVMRTPEPEVQHSCACGGGCPKCQTKQPVSEPERLQTKPIGLGDSGQTEAPLIHETLNSPGRPLDPTTQSFMEERFAHDFDHVRIHTDANAAASARALQARAFTVDANVVFGHNQFAPTTAEGQRLIAHELTHVIQQESASSESPRERSAVQEKNQFGSVSPVSDLSISVAPSRISRSPLPQSETQDMHGELIEQFRRANGFPPHGIDPATGQQVGPTDSEIRFGGLLDAWLLANRPARQTQAPGAPASPTQTPPAQAPAVRSVPAPTQAPAVVGPGGTSVVAACSSAPDVGACLQHRTYVLNILPQAIANIRRVSSPYSAAIADLYAAALPAAQAASAPIPAGSPNAQFGRSVRAPGGTVTVRFGATTFTFTQFSLDLEQQGGLLNGQAFGAGNPVASVTLNESSNDAVHSNLAGIEATMTHETMHIFMEIIEGLNRGRTANTPMVDANLDRTSYATLQTSLETALLPFIRQIRQLPSFTGSPAPLTAQQDAAGTAATFLSETIARTEAGIFEKQRLGQAFTAADLRTLPPFFHAASYWSPTPPRLFELINFIQTNQPQIDAAIQPIIHQIGERYLNLRP